MKKILYFCFFFFLIPLSVFAFNIDSLKGLDSYVYDEVGVLTPEEKNNLNQVILDIRKKYTVEVLTALIKTTDGEAIGSLGTNIGHTLGVGKKDVDNGLVILIAVNDRAWNISTGYGIEGAIPDIIANRIGTNNFPPNFRKGDYYSGVYNALKEIDGYIAKDPGVISKYTDTPSNEIQIDPSFLFRYFFIATAISFFLFRSDLRSGNMGSFFKKFLIVYLVTLPISYFIIGVYAFLINFFIWLFASLYSSGNGRSGGGGSFGGGGFSSGSHSSGGFGGGGFGGGGSSGRW